MVNVKTRGKKMKILILTGKLASEMVNRLSSESEHQVHTLTINTPIAAFLTPRRIIQELEKLKLEYLTSFEMIITPGLIRKDVSPVEDKTGIPTYKGPKDAADLPVVLEMIEKLDLSSQVPADKLIEDELRQRALQFIEDFENDEINVKKLLRKPENIMVGDLPVGEDFPMRVLAEIANAPLLTDDELLKRAQYYLNNGAHMIDIGMIAGESLEEKIPGMVKLLKDNLGDVPVSIDSLNSKELTVAIESGVDLVLSLDHGNLNDVLPLLQDYKIPAVILPTDFSKNWTPDTVEERVSSLESLMLKCKDIDVIADLILDPINSKSIVDSVMACRDFKKRNRIPLFMGVGNVTELLDTDSVGANALLSGIAMELGASVLFTVEESGKTLGSVRELNVSSKMMFLAKSRGSIPKDLGINLLVLKDKRKGETVEEEMDVPLIYGEEDYAFTQDPLGSFKITVKDSTIHAVHYKKMQPTVSVRGKTAKALYDMIIKEGLLSRIEHATYLGAELQKAEIAAKLGKNYTQDFPLF
jgi:dihydropteroate synthase-like protein